MRHLKATFYRHFRDKYDVLNYNSLGITKRYFNVRLCGGWQDFFVCAFREVEKDLDYYRRAFRTSGQNAHARFLFEYTYSIVRDCFLKTNRKETPDPRGAFRHFSLLPRVRGYPGGLAAGTQRRDRGPDGSAVLSGDAGLSQKHLDGGLNRETVFEKRINLRQIYNTVLIGGLRLGISYGMV